MPLLYRRVVVRGYDGGSVGRPSWPNDEATGIEFGLL
jgi:hypothetical protein